MAKEFIMRIELGNDAMQTMDDLAGAVTAIAARLAQENDAGTIRDINGNRIGSYRIQDRTMSTTRADIICTGTGCIVDDSRK